MHQVTSDYNIIASTTGSYDAFLLCNFNDTDAMYKLGANIWRKICAEEEPQISEAMLTDVLIGKWTFHPDNYKYYKNLIDIGDKKRNYHNLRSLIKKGKFKNEFVESI